MFHYNTAVTVINVKRISYLSPCHLGQDGFPIQYKFLILKINALVFQPHPCLFSHTLLCIVKNPVLKNPSKTINETLKMLNQCKLRHVDCICFHFRHGQLDFLE